jgi:uncharacterized protein
MARKPRKPKTDINAAKSERIEGTSSMPRPALLLIFAIVLLMLGVTVGVVIDVVMSPDPAQRGVSPQNQAPARPSRDVPPPRIEVPKTPSFYDIPPKEAEPKALEAPVVVAPVPVLSPLALNALPIEAPPGWPVVAIVIDDMGLDAKRAEKVLALSGPLTVSYLTYAEDLKAQAKRAIDAGHEVMAHIPMEPVGPADPGPGALMAGTSSADLRERLDSYLNNWSGYVGINNHMGSKLTADRAAMDVVMMELKGRGLMWLDSRTDSATVGEASAQALGVPYLGRDVFLDNEDDEEAIAGQLLKVEEIAQNQGYAVAIGHPRDATIKALAAWMDTLDEKRIALVPITEVLSRRSEPRG